MAEAVGLRLKSIREFHGWSQRELAKRAGVPNSAISVIEQGSVSPSIQSLEKVLKGFPLSLCDFFAITPGRHLCKITRTDAHPDDNPLVAELHVDGETPARPLNLKAYMRSPADEPISAMGKANTLILITAGEVQFHSLGVDQQLQTGNSVTLVAPVPYRIVPLETEACWVVTCAD